MDTAERVRSGSEFRLRLRATTAATSTLRTGLRGWLSDIGASTDESLDLQLACSEVLTMVVRDGAGLVVDVEGWFQDGLVGVAIREHGLCRNVDRIELDQDGTFSVALIQAVVDDVDIRARPDGRTVVLSRRLQRSTRASCFDSWRLSGA
jgi:anti-sigma regulatory factor (Ser/Thr protein kinase)